MIHDLAHLDSISTSSHDIQDTCRSVLHVVNEHSHIGKDFYAHNVSIENETPSPFTLPSSLEALASAMQRWGNQQHTTSPSPILDFP